jgi:hypothetical protein
LGSTGIKENKMKSVKIIAVVIIFGVLALVGWNIVKNFTKDAIGAPLYAPAAPKPSNPPFMLSDGRVNPAIKLPLIGHDGKPVMVGGHEVMVGIGQLAPVTPATPYGK